MSYKARKLTLHDCVISRDLNKLTILLDDGAPIDERDKNGWSPLHRAAWLGHTEIVKVLISYGADVNFKSRFRQTPLHRSACKGHNLIVKVLFRHGANVNVEDVAGQTPLHVSAASGNTETVRLLIQYGADIDAVNWLDDTPLMWSKSYGHKDVTEILKEAKYAQADNLLHKAFASEYVGSSTTEKVGFQKTNDKGQVSKVNYEKKEVKGHFVTVSESLTESGKKGNLCKMKSITSKDDQALPSSPSPPPSKTHETKDDIASMVRTAVETALSRVYSGVVSDGNNRVQNDPTLNLTIYNNSNNNNNTIVNCTSNSNNNNNKSITNNNSSTNTYQVETAETMAMNCNINYRQQPPSDDDSSDDDDSDDSYSTADEDAEDETDEIPFEL